MQENRKGKKNFFSLVMRTLNNFQVCQSSLAVGTLLCSTYIPSTYLSYNWKLVPFDPFLQFPLYKLSNSFASTYYFFQCQCTGISTFSFASVSQRELSSMWINSYVIFNETLLVITETFEINLMVQQSRNS